MKYMGSKLGKFYKNEKRKRVKVEEWMMWKMGGIGKM